MNKLRYCLLLLGIAASAYGQSETGSSAIEGQIRDSAGTAIPGAKVSAKEADTGVRRETLTNAEGQFRLSALPVGSYRVAIEAKGFSPAMTDAIVLTVGGTRTLNLRLDVAAVSTQITVESNASVVNVTDISNSVNINSRAIEDLPIRGRNFTEFVQLSPNVTQEGNRFGIVVNGQRAVNSNIALDGVDFNDPLQGGPRGGGPKESAFFFPQLAVREFQMVLNGASAEVGRTNAGYLNVVTKSGTNSFHGAGFYENRNGTMTSPDAFGNDSSSNSQHQFGGAFGGPITRDRTFFYGAVEKNMVNVPYTVKFSTPGIAMPADIAAMQGNFNQKNNPLVAFGRVDHRLSTRNSLNLQYTYAAQSGLNFGGQSGQTTAAVTNNTSLDRASQGVKGGLTTVLSPTLINELRGQWVYDNRIQAPVSSAAEVDIGDLGTIGGNADGTFIYNATRIQFLDNLAWSHGIHSVKFGIDANYSPEQQQREKYYGGVYAFNTLSDYEKALAGDKTKINRYQQTIAANGKIGFYDDHQEEYAVYITDTMKLRKDFTLTAGLRWEGQVNPQPPANPQFPINGQIPNDFKMWQPRLGFAYNVAGKDKTVIRVSAGLFDSRTPAYLMHRIFTDNGFATVLLDSQTDPTIVNYLTIPNSLQSLPNGLKSSSNAVYAFDSTFRNPRSAQVSIAVEQQIDHATKVTVGYVRNSTWALQRRLDTNLFQPTVLANGFVAYPTVDAQAKLVQASDYNPLTGQGVYLDSAGKALKAVVVRPDPSIGQFNVNKSVGHSTYDGGYISVQRRMSRRFQFGANYTYAKARDDDSNERDYNRQYMLNVFNLKSDAAYSKSDLRHSGNFNVLYDLGRGFTISTLLLARTGSPGRYVIGSDLNNDGNKDNDRPVIDGHLAPRDSVRLPNFFNWDMRLLKEFQLGERARLTLSIEGYNLTTAGNKSFNSDGDSTFGKPQAAINPATGFAYVNSSAGIPTTAPGTDRLGGPRQGQIGVRFVF